MRLDQLVPAHTVSHADGSVEVTSVEIDSRRCESGTLFFAMPGGTFDGTQFVADAIRRGAVAVVSASALEVSVPHVRVSSSELHALVVRASATITQHPEANLTLAGVTGTNGKTTVTTLLAGLWRTLGHRASVIGTLTHERTTPASPELFRELANAVTRSESRPLVALEVSSHALDQGRVDGLVFDVAAFTNLSQDHLDYHSSMEQYFESKATLFRRERCRTAVVMADDEWGQRLVQRPLVPTTVVRRADATDVVLGVGESTFVWRGHHVRTKLTGAYNVDNTLVVLAMATTLGVSEIDAVVALSALDAVPGRMDVVRSAHPAVVVDYAHTPDGLAAALQAVRDVRSTGTLVVTFGCGGDRDREKRPLMGAVATAAADVTILTNDNPRSESPETIIDAIAAGCRAGADVRKITDRRDAIAEGLRVAHGGDGVLLIAGKGHERTQIVGEQVLTFDDREVAIELLGEMAC